jgi:hypothetical protein
MWLPSLQGHAVVFYKGLQHIPTSSSELDPRLHVHGLWMIEHAIAITAWACGAGELGLRFLLHGR